MLIRPASRSPTAHGQVRYQFKMLNRDGTTHEMLPTRGFSVLHNQHTTTNYNNKYNTILNPFNCCLLPFLAIICQQVRHESAMKYAYYPPISIAPDLALNTKLGHTWAMC